MEKIFKRLIEGTEIEEDKKKKLLERILDSLFRRTEKNRGNNENTRDY